MSRQDWAFIVGVLGKFYLETDSITQRNTALKVLEKLYKEVSHD